MPRRQPHNQRRGRSPAGPLPRRFSIGRAWAAWHWSVRAFRYLATCPRFAGGVHPADVFGRHLPLELLPFACRGTLPPAKHPLGDPFVFVL